MRLVAATGAAAAAAAAAVCATPGPAVAGAGAGVAEGMSALACGQVPASIAIQGRERNG